jgi:hypothetical protein
MSNANEPPVPASPQDDATGEQSSSAEESFADDAGDGAQAADSIQLPPRKPVIHWPTTPEQIARELNRLDWTALVVGVVFAFLIASFAIRNTDYWMHLATGRLLANRNYELGKDPFAYTTRDAYWVNHSWLFDFGLYGLTALVGGPESKSAGMILVGARGLLTAVVFCLMVGIGRRGQSRWLPIVCAILAVLSMSPRLQIQPLLVSVLFLAVTLYILIGPRSADRIGASSLNRYWLLPPLFLLWVNLDSWFFLGPLTVLLYLAGQLVQTALSPVRTGADAPERDQPGRLGLVLLVGLAACLVNPHHYHAFTLPSHLSWSGPRDLLNTEPSFSRWFRNPIDEFRAPETGRLSIVAFDLLFVLGFLSFVLSLASVWRWWRLFVWLPFAALAAYQFRNAALFAVVAAPITALNLQDFAEVWLGKRVTTERSWTIWSLVGRIGTVVLCLLLAAAAWPGWLHDRVSWTVVVDPSLKGAAEQLKEWRSSGALASSANGLNYSPETVSYFAWFCADERGTPLEKSFFDYRLQLFSNSVIKDYLDVRRSLRGDAGRARSSDLEPVNWQEILNRYKINHVILYGTSPEPLAVDRRLLPDWEQWRIVYMDGRTTVFTWHPQTRAQANQPELPRLDLNALAFGPDPERSPKHPTRQPEPQSFWVRFRDGPPRSSLAAAKSLQYQNYFEQIASAWPYPGLLASEFIAWGGAAASSSGSAAMTPRIALHLNPLPLRKMLGMRSGPYLNLFLAGRDLGPPAATILAVRAARRAVAESPDSADAYLTLAQAYMELLNRQENHWLPIQRQEQELVSRQKLRQVQIITALEQSLKLNDDDAAVHDALATQYLQLGYLDLAASHLDETLKRLVKLKPESDEVARIPQLTPGPVKDRVEQFNWKINERQEAYKRLDTAVISGNNEYRLNAQGQPSVVRAQLAKDRGLAGQALEVLGGLTPEESTDVATAMNLDLLISTGKADELQRLILEDQDLGRLLRGPFARYRVLLAAAIGDYEDATSVLEAIIHQTESDRMRELLVKAHGGTFPGTFQNPLNPFILYFNAQALDGAYPGAYQNALNAPALRGLVNYPDAVRQLADLRVVEGLLLLEEGENARAAGYFRQALDCVGSDQVEFNGRVFANRYLTLIKQAGR